MSWSPKQNGSYHLYLCLEPFVFIYPFPSPNMWSSSWHHHHHVMIFTCFTTWNVLPISWSLDKLGYHLGFHQFTKTKLELSSSHNLRTLMTVEIGCSAFKERDDVAASHWLDAGRVRLVDLTEASGRLDFQWTEEPTALFHRGFYLSPMAGSSSLS